MNPSTEPTFEQALLELERIVRELEDGDTTLELALERYEHGVNLLRRCYEQLRNVEQRIVELTGKDEAGNPVLRSFEHTSSMKQVKRD
jgi:exodeoxyribonuclease VII small subunit